MTENEKKIAAKETFPLRLPPDTYRKVRDRVQKEKDKGNYAYSINDFLTEIIEKELKEKK